MKWPEKIRVMQLKKREGWTPARNAAELAVLNPDEALEKYQEERVYVLEKKRTRKKKS
jgi:hypothetical protein